MLYSRSRLTQRLVSAMITLISCLAAASTIAEETHYDYADVLWVRAMTGQVAVPVMETRCEPAREDTAGSSGALRDRYPGLGLADVIRQEQRHMPRAPRCSDFRRTRYENEIVGYRVAYRYAGTDYERTLDYDPGNRLRVRVEVQAGK